MECVDQQSRDPIQDHTGNGGSLWPRFFKFERVLLRVAAGSVSLENTADRLLVLLFSRLKRCPSLVEILLGHLLENAT